MFEVTSERERVYNLTSSNDGYSYQIDEMG